MSKQISIETERDLHYKVIDLIRNKFQDLQVVAGLGELQDTVFKRCDAYKKGYVGGQPDILILNQTPYASGFAIELKTPTGNWTLAAKQKSYLERLAMLRYKTLVSDDYDEVLIALTRYHQDTYKESRFQCEHCLKLFKFNKALTKHMRQKHGK